MTESTTRDGVSNDENFDSGDGVSNDDKKPGDGGASNKQVNYEDHKRAIDDLHKYKSKWRESSEKIDELTQQLENMKQTSLKEKEDYKSLYEQTVGQLDEERNRNKSLKDSVIYSEKYRAVYPQLKKMGFRDEAQNLLDMLDLKDLEVETTSEGRFLVSGVDQWAETFKAKYPYAFKQALGPTVNSPGSSLPPKEDKLTPAKLFEIEKECRKKGDMAPYYDAFKKYNQSLRS